MLLGSDVVQPKWQSATTKSEILIGELYPAVLKYSTKTETLEVGLDYTTKVQKKNEAGSLYEAYYKPAEQARRNSVKEQELEKRLVKKTCDDWIDNSNIPQSYEDDWEEPMAEALDRTKRKRPKSMRLMQNSK